MTTFYEASAMKKMTLFGLLLFCFIGTVRADGFYFGYGYAPVYAPSYDAVDAMSDREVAAINAREQAEVMHELREGDYREAQMILQQDEALKREIRREEAQYDAARDMNGYGYYNYGYNAYDFDDD
jgi:hypothetical protein